VGDRAVDVGTARAVAVRGRSVHRVKLEEITPNARVAGIVADGPVEIV
jgi:hypothetical protein